MNSAAAILSVHFGSVCSKASVAVKRTISHIGSVARDIRKVVSDKLGGPFAKERKRHRKTTARKPLDKGFEVQTSDVSAVFVGESPMDFSDQVHPCTASSESTTMKFSLSLPAGEEEDFFQNTPSFDSSFFSGLEEGVHMHPDGRLVMAAPCSQVFPELAMREPFLWKPLASYEVEKKNIVTNLEYFMGPSHVTCTLAESAASGMKARVLYSLKEVITNIFRGHLNSCVLMKNILEKAGRWRDSDRPPTLKDFDAAFFSMRCEARRYRWLWPRGSPTESGEYTPRK